jgi:hypothetical protein
MFGACPGFLKQPSFSVWLGRSGANSANTITQDTNRLLAASGNQLCHAAKVLRDGGERELVLRTAWASRCAESKEVNDYRP